MTLSHCPRLWEVEAARDGRLRAAELGSHERHRLDCPVCGERWHELVALAEDLRASPPPTDELGLRRVRQAVLREAAASWLARGDEPARRLRPIALICAGVTLALCVLVLARQVDLSPKPRADLVVAMPRGFAEWTRSRAGGVERIDLRDGSLGLLVRRRANDPRVVVRVPDGEIEDRGTRFSVSVRGGHTVEIVVTEGLVVFRRPGLLDLSLEAGAAWTQSLRRNEGSAKSSAVAPSREPSPVASRGVSRVSPLGPSIRRAPTSRRGIIEASAQPGVVAVPDASDEDVAYLQIVALLRETRDEEARIAAIEYLKRFPRGFRRLEIDRLLERASRPASGDTSRPAVRAPRGSAL